MINTNHLDMRRILILGNGASGKSTAARELHKRLHHPILHLDSLYWMPHWKHKPKDEFIKKSRQFAAQDHWIIEGTPRCDLEYRLKKSTLVIFLETSTFNCILRLCKRSYRCLWHNNNYADGCPANHISWIALRWICRFNQSRKPNILAACENLASHKMYFTRSIQDMPSE